MPKKEKKKNNPKIRNTKEHPPDIKHKKRQKKSIAFQTSCRKSSKLPPCYNKSSGPRLDSYSVPFPWISISSPRACLLASPVVLSLRFPGGSAFYTRFTTSSNLHQRIKSLRNSSSSPSFRKTIPKPKRLISGSCNNRLSIRTHRKI